MSLDAPVWSKLVRDEIVAEHVPLAGLTTYRFGGPARYYADIGSQADLDRLVAAMVEAPVDVLVVGRGSNLVVSDRGFDGVAIKLSGEFLHVDLDGEIVTAGGAVALPRLARIVSRAGRSGLEFLVGVPGSVGGAVAMNAGCFGSETADWLVEASLVDLLSGATRTATPVGLDHRYRHSNVGPHELVVRATFRTEAGDPGESEAKMREITQWRKRTQPGGTHNAGSVFKNPRDDAAGRLIDEAGCKGFRVGGASVSQRHANFFVATDEARAQDVFDLVATVRQKVLDHSGIALLPEIRFAGEFEQTPGGEDTEVQGAGGPS